MGYLKLNNLHLLKGKKKKELVDNKIASQFNINNNINKTKVYQQIYQPTSSLHDERTATLGWKIKSEQ